MGAGILVREAVFQVRIAAMVNACLIRAIPHAVAVKHVRMGNASRFVVQAKRCAAATSAARRTRCVWEDSVSRVQRDKKKSLANNG